jgi:hypothetical protein
VARTYLATWATPTIAIIRGSRHNTFSDASDDPRARATLIESVDLHRNKHDGGS